MNMSDFYDSIDDVPPLKGLDLMAASFASSADLDGHPITTLERAISSLEHTYGIEIDWKEKTNE